MYHIKTVAGMIGVPAVTIRAWENRYGVVAPTRTEGGHRVYTDQDVDDLRWLKEQIDVRRMNVSQAAHLLKQRKRQEANAPGPLPAPKPALPDENGETERRKTEHIRLCLEEDVAGKRITNGLELYRFRHRALPELDFAEIDTSSAFLGRRLRVPLLVSSMTGGTRLAADINRRLAEAAQRRGWAMGVGSVRAALERPETAYSFRIRDIAPTIPLLANLGAVQLGYGYGAEECRRAVELVEADGLVLHLNGLQEVFQPGGNTNFAGLLGRIESVCRSLDVPVGVKEVGWGIDGETARQLRDAGVAFIDVAGAGGTSWSEVERLRQSDPIRRMAAEAFADWGLPTAECVRDVRQALGPEAVVAASGGITSGVEAAKAIALGADIAGLGRTLLAPSVGGGASGTDSDAERLEAAMERVEFELRVAMFGIGAGTLAELRGTNRLERLG